ncbi:hypothetical protein PoB_005241300 [Plakobranchus ocellatus]|uniref:Uncharacterized protein n=1 Tax=Plakobranchus ocellatus TaxID=259542 RepID=A0AAV4C3C1_9GAST|nr:hypothetical protein PoB_005241300 [Plakobranchus ocellatus]
MVHKEDYGEYWCIGSNDLGEDTGKMTLYEYSVYRKAQLATTTSTTTTRRPPRPSYIYPPREQYSSRGYSSGSDNNGYNNNNNNRNTYTDPHQKQHIVQDGRLRYETQRPSYGHVAADSRGSRGDDSSSKDSSTSLHLTTGRTATKLATLMLIFIVLRRTCC